MSRKGVKGGAPHGSGEAAASGSRAPDPEGGPSSTAPLRARAQKRLGKASGPWGTDHDPERLLHELRVHQVELELQNEELQGAHRDLEQASRVYAELYDLAPVGYFTLDAAGIILRTNLKGASLLGYPRSQLAGELFRTFVAGRDREHFARFLGTVFDCAGEGTRTCHVGVVAGGRDVFARIDGSALPGERACRLAVIDRTEDQRREEDLKESRARAEEAVRVKSAFLANMSHEIRTPLSGILGMGEVLRSTPLRPDQQVCVDSIQASGRLLLDVVNDILDLSRIEAGRLTLDSVEFALRAAVEDTVHLFGETAQSKGLELCCLVSPEVPARSVGDPARLRQVLYNLLGNAVKFTERGHVAVWAGREIRRGAPMLRVEVEDTGAGISVEAQGKVFESFFQADSSSSRRHGGTGLGLAICQRLVTAMGGEIGFRSTPGAGSTFWFLLPERPRVALSEPLPSFFGVRALAVVAHPVTRSFLEAQLRALGVEPTAVSSAGEARRLAAEAASEGRPFRLLVAEQELPDGGGLALQRELSATVGPAGLGVVLLVPFTAQGIAANALAPDADSYLLKPVRESDLARCVAAALHGATPSPNVAPPPKRPERRGRVLVAEDNPLNQRVVTLLLDTLGYEADLADDGEQAVAKALAEEHDLILMDWQMPGMDGLEATKRIRSRRAPGQGPPIVAMTAHAFEEHRQQCLAAGMDDHLSKPVSLDSLSRVLDEWTARGRPRPVDPAPKGLLASLRARLSQDKVSELTDIFVETAPADLEAIRTALAGQDPGAVARSSHHFRSSCLILGLEKASKLLADMEQRAAQGDMAAARELRPELERDVEELLAQLPPRRDGAG